MRFFGLLLVSCCALCSCKIALGPAGGTDTAFLGSDVMAIVDEETAQDGSAEEGLIDDGVFILDEPICPEADVIDAVDEGDEVSDEDAVVFPDIDILSDGLPDEDEYVEDPDSPFLPVDHIPDLDNAPDMIDAIYALKEAACYRLKRCDPVFFNQVYHGVIYDCIASVMLTCDPSDMEEAQACAAEMNSYPCNDEMPTCVAMCE